ncbi:phytanoyl-CoA dioxygenase family protein [Hyphococcus flavus]|uniref:Phytanoyl-CoA dioxygenase family protein n=1 Tax=Hyphococcus flavus TaxID=1866326 RepID=A0AAE9ZH11_9PROT|nr:phytanoyl-CoA dioxygenase family protein [Hyphococcus flavus]WDI32627.1 phytanoyl-CoA dioxygenase family protein [Hyphococcus flavus]
MRNVKDTLEREGRVWFRNSLSDSALKNLDRNFSSKPDAGHRHEWAPVFDGFFGAGSEVAELVQSIVPHAKPVRLVSFNKVTDNNWSLPWHQDRVIAVRDRHDVDNFSNWSQKEGTWHCEPPISFLENMVFVRIHLDDATQGNGSLELALGSHKSGYIAADKAAATADCYPVELCRATRGDVLIIKMLTLHRSRASTTAANRRAIRIDYSPDSLPQPLTWATSHS